MFLMVENLWNLSWCKFINKKYLQKYAFIQSHLIMQYTARGFHDKFHDYSSKNLKYRL